MEPDVKTQLMQRTNITSEDQAKRLMNALNIYFTVVVMASFMALPAMMEFVGQAEGPEIWMILTAFSLYFIFFILFVKQVVKVLEALNLPKWYLIFLFVFAPISWIILIPMLTQPLKIMSGKSSPKGSSAAATIKTFDFIQGRASFEDLAESARTQAEKAQGYNIKHARPKAQVAKTERGSFIFNYPEAKTPVNKQPEYASKPARPEDPSGPEEVEGIEPRAVLVILAILLGLGAFIAYLFIAS